MWVHVLFATKYLLCCFISTRDIVQGVWCTDAATKTTNDGKGNYNHTIQPEAGETCQYLCAYNYLYQKPPIPSRYQAHTL
jgi:hypothetical protein